MQAFDLGQCQSLSPDFNRGRSAKGSQAWVLGSEPGARGGRSILLYDEDGRAMAIIASASTESCAG